MAEVATAKLAAGSIKLETITIKSEVTKDTIDLKSIVTEFNIYESISAPFITADLVIGDALALTTKLPIIGQEEVEIKFKTPDPSISNSINLKLRVVRIQELTRTNQRTMQYVIKLASEEYFSDLNTKISKAFVGKTISDMIKDIGTYSLQMDRGKVLYASETEGERTIVIPNMAPTKAINFLCKEAKSPRYPASNFIFFENCNGFQFKTVDELIIAPYPDLRNPSTPNTTPPADGSPGSSPEIGGNSPESRQTNIDYYYATDKDFNKGGADSVEWRGGVQSKKPFELQKINGFRFVSLFNNDLTTIRGGFETRYMYLNPVLSTYEERTYDYFKNFYDLEHTTATNEGQLLTDKNLNISKSGDSHQIFVMTNKGETDTMLLDQKTDFLHLKVGSLGLLEDIVVDVDIPGDTDRRAGDLVRMQFPEFGATDDVKGKINKFVSGDYLVVAIRHHYNGENGYRCIMSCMKNCYETDIESLPQIPQIDEAPVPTTALPATETGSTPEPRSGSIRRNRGQL